MTERDLLQEFELEHGVALAAPRAALRDLWDSLETAVYRVLDPEDGSNPENGHLRNVCGTIWLYVDDVDGFSLKLTEQVVGLTLELAE